MDQDQLALLPLWYAVFLLSVTCHEAAHAWAAYRGGDDTAYRGGQVSLNPLPHVRREPFGSVLVPLLSFMNMGWMMGWASAPYDPLWEDRYPRRAAWMAAAGPLTNLLLAVLGFAVLKAGLLSGTWQVPVSDHYELDRLVVPGATAAAGLGGLGRFFSILLSLNVVLFLFNLLPLPPMDGASVLAGLFAPARQLRDRVRENPVIGLLGIVVAWFLFGGMPAIGWRGLFWPVYIPVVHWLWG